MALKMNFTAANLNAQKPPVKGDRYIYDIRTPGLVFGVTANNSRAFYRYGRTMTPKGWQPRRIKLGNFPDISIEQARDMAVIMNGAIAKDIDPQTERRTARAKAADVTTLGDLFSHWLQHHAKVFKKSWAEDEALFGRYLTKWRGRDLNTITRLEVQMRHAEIGKAHGHYAANRCLALLSGMFNHAVTLGHERMSPTFKVKRFKEQSRERFLTADELPRFFAALETEPNTTIRDFILLCLMTGARRGNVLAMQWLDIDLAGQRWTIPDTKAGTPQTVYLSAEAARILAERKVTAASPWVFPGRKLTPGKRGESDREPVGHLTDPKKAWTAMLERAEIKNLRIHDLRRTLGSWQAATGAGLPIIGRTLGHRNQSTTAIYARLNLDPVKAAVETATHAMLTAGEPEKDAKI